MAIAETVRGAATTDERNGVRQAGSEADDEWGHWRPANVSSSERALSVAAGSIIALLGLSRRSWPGVTVAAVGGGLIYRGLSGHCPVYGGLGINTARDDDRTEVRDRSNVGETVEESIDAAGIHVEQAFLINKSPEVLYRYWRNFENLPQIMTHLERVAVIDERRSHWVARTIRIAGQLEWDAEIIADEPNSRIAWRSLPGSDIDTRGEIRFTPAMGDRGTEVHVTMEYVPPAGRIGHWIATMLGSSPRRMLRDDLRNFKRIMEVGEILTVEGQPRGTCRGHGEREGE